MNTSQTSTVQSVSSKHESKNIRREMLLNLGINVAAPMALFYGLRGAGLNQWVALAIGMAPALLRAVYTVVKQRKIDFTALFSLSVMLFSIVISFVTGSPRLLLAKDGLLTVVIGGWILLSLLRMPFIFQLTRSMMSDEARERADLKWAKSPTYRHVIRVITAIWGVVLVLDAGVRVLLAYTLPIDSVPLISGLQFIGVYIVIEVATRIYSRRKGFAEAVEAEAGVPYM
ncbi:VC0807 family protein [Amycolatopsis sp. VS8301801F10]|uniref:VC0807 family protein n=1 Tax=unclassified Amycolatopsis TaxID=2618356 RepID=UPI0038FC18BE